MDAFLRRVIAQREREQEEAILAARFEVALCEICGERLNESNGPARRVCTRCGGRKRQAVLEREEARAAWIQSLVSIVVPTSEVTMSDKKTCSVCGKPLRIDNTRGVHAACATGDEPRAPRATGGEKSIKKSFRLVTEALGFDGDDLVEKFMRGWLDRVRGSVRMPEDE
jgi:predicted RNA-binding Zn-ribbon protein involved in translation (DUF1610 family)